MASDLSLQDIDHIARLARLELSAAEKEQYRQELSAILGYVAMLDEVDTSQVEETCQVTGLEDVFREDVVIEMSDEDRKAMLEQFPERIGSLLKVKAVFTTDSGE